MREEELRSLLAGYTESADPVPSPAALRGRATRRRLAPLGVGLAAVVAVGALVAPQFVTRPAVPDPASHPNPTVTPSRTPASSPTATLTPSPAATPTLSCPEFRAAWREAMASTRELPAELGEESGIGGDYPGGTVAAGIVDGRQVVRLYPDGLAGDSYALPPASRGWHLYVIDFTGDRVVFAERRNGAGDAAWRIFVKDGRDAEPRLLFEYDTASDPRVHWSVPWEVVGDVLRWNGWDGEENAYLPDQRHYLMEVSLTDPEDQPREVFDLGMGARWAGQDGDEVYYERVNGSHVAFNRVTLAPVPVPPYLTDGSVGAGASDRWRLYRPDGNSDSLWVRDLETDATYFLYDGWENTKSTSGNLVLILEGRRVTLGDLATGNTIELMDDNPSWMSGPYRLSAGYLRRSADHIPGKPGVQVPLDTLPTSIPAC